MEGSVFRNDLNNLVLFYLSCLAHNVPMLVTWLACETFNTSEYKTYVHSLSLGSCLPYRYSRMVTGPKMFSTVLGTP